VRVGDVDVGVAAATRQVGELHPLLVVGRRIDVRPADRGADGDPLEAAVLAAARVDAALRRAPELRMGAVEVAKAVDLLRADIGALRAFPVRVQGPKLEASGVAELPVGALIGDVLEDDRRPGVEVGVSAAALLDSLAGAHRPPARALASQLRRPVADAVDRVPRSEDRRAAGRAVALDVEGRPHAEVRTQELTLSDQVGVLARIRVDP
jgi:hypothetical protein